MKKIIVLPVIVFVTICFCLCGCLSSDPMKAKMQEKIGFNQEIIGSYDERVSAVCNNGTFVGVADGDVVSFKGMPYAKPPIGELRWKSPVLVEDREGVYEAKYFGKSPIQSEWPSEVGSYYQQGEDCLFLNIWTNLTGPSEGKTVMVFFHGGSYGWGATSDPMYDGHNLVEKYPDIVLVTVGYRTGIMGFIDFSNVPGGEEFATSGNLGLLDQVCALQWVQKNIGAFGGDPNNVTIFGESAGGGSVSLLPLIEGTNGLFHRIISESGAPSLTYSKDECENLTHMLLESSGCSTMEELMALSEEELMKLNEGLNDSNNFPERDGFVLPYDLYAAWEDESLADIDILLGTNSDECRYWIREMGYYAPFLPKGFVYTEAMPFMYENNFMTLSDDEKDLVNQFMNMQSGRNIWKQTEFYNELLFRIPAVEQAVRHKGKSYNYYWTMSGADNTLGACHAIELAYVFRNPLVDIYTGGFYNEKLADTVQDMWVNFARSGDPSTEEYIWEPYTVESRKTMVLGDEIGMVEDLKSEQRVLIEPLLDHYFNGCYSQLDYNVPQLYRIIAQVLAILILIVVVVFIIVKSVKKRKDS